MADKVEQIRAEVERLKKCSESAKKEWVDEGYNQNAFAEDCRIKSFNKLLSFIDSMNSGVDYDKLDIMLDDALSKETKESWNERLGKEEPVSDDMEKAAEKYAYELFPSIGAANTETELAFKAGAKWQANQGVTKEAVIGMATEEIVINVSQSTLNALDLCAGDKVVIQLRKKEV